MFLREEKERVIAHCNTPEPGPGRGHRVGAAGDPEWGSCWGSTLRPGRWSPVGSLAGRERCCSACRQRGGEFHTRRAAGCCWGCAGRTGFPPRLLAGETLESGSWSDWPGLRAGPLLRARGAGAGARRWLKTHRNSWEKHQTPRAGSALPASQGLAKGAAQRRCKSDPAAAELPPGPRWRLRLRAQRGRVPVELPGPGSGSAGVRAGPSLAAWGARCSRESTTCPGLASAPLCAWFGNWVRARGLQPAGSAPCPGSAAFRWAPDASALVGLQAGAGGPRAGRSSQTRGSASGGCQEEPAGLRELPPLRRGTGCSSSAHLGC